MKDTQILKMIEETCKVLAVMEWHQDGTILTSSYNGVLEAAQKNHPAHDTRADTVAGCFR